MEQLPVEHEAREHAGVARNQNVVFVLPHDAAAVAEFLPPVLDRIDPDLQATQLLVLTPDVETALTVAETVTRASGVAPLRVVPVTAAHRAMRLLGERPATVLIGSPTEVLALIRDAAVKLDALRALVLAWGDLIADAGHVEALEAVMAEVPKDAPRTIVTSQMTPAVEALVERYARRARRAGNVEWSEADGTNVRYMVVAPQSRPTALRRLLDDLDPERTAVYVRSDGTAAEVATLRRTLGYGDDDTALTITHGTSVPDATLVVLYDLPPSREVLRALADGKTGGRPDRMFALITPRQLSTLHSLAGTGCVAPYTLSGAAGRARKREEELREELRTVLAAGVPSRELLAIEPLLDAYDGAEVAAAALRLLERERQENRERAPRAAEAAPAAGAASTTRVFISAGTRDNITPRDLVGAIANEGGISGDRIGKIELRESHAVVEIAADVAPQVIARLTGTSLRGRRIVARLDKDRPARERSERPRARSHDEEPRTRRGARPRTPRPPTPRPDRNADE